MKWIWGIIGAIAVGLILAWSFPALALPRGDLTPLTVELFQERLNNPIPQDGKETLDFSKLFIDLTAENTELRDRFYSQLQAKINRTAIPLSLDFSQSVIRGDFQVSQWGIKVQLIEEVLASFIVPADLEKLHDKLGLPTLPPSGQNAQNIPYITLVRGTLKLKDTQFEGKVDFSNTLFLQPLEAAGMILRAESQWEGSIWLNKVNLNGGHFARLANFEKAHFFAVAQLEDTIFRGLANFRYARFESKVSFARSQFFDVANFLGTLWQDRVDFMQITCHNRVLLSRSLLARGLDFWDSTFEKAVAFRESHFQDILNFKDVHLLEQVDLSNAVFQGGAYFNVDGLAFDSNEAKILGDKGEIGQVIQVPSLQGNETVLLNLVRNFRRLEQIPDANNVEYLRSQLQAIQLEHRLAEFSWYQWLSWSFNRDLLLWLGLSVLLLLSDYGTNFSLVLTVGIWSSAYFGVLFWIIDRSGTTRSFWAISTEVIAMLSSFSAITLIAATALFRVAQNPGLTIACLSIVLFPIPLALTALIYQSNPQDEEVTYFVEDGGMRQLRLLIVRLPIMPRFVFFRNRFAPILRDRRWGWLNYYDFSLNNLLKFGFNDIRLRDRHLPGLISTLAWYQWGLGLLYVALLLWTLSRSIPGLNLLLYLS
ncbi:MAG: pentapeptide repeat-containing protein [Jaaginema sp. PMC 1079.18]|nr:pentapeptide repeat-containing protein [Jaaginema sp. PMC 1080.18]MEC4850198.1 pentapeptide repeat-containing protein [Jaaginema sp. PMC 1079.18]MEC4865289.1 pentapeptide repeat-containing protein [Jaaginema sp. PMC 1078.18]